MAAEHGGREQEVVGEGGWMEMGMRWVGDRTGPDMDED